VTRRAVLLLGGCVTLGLGIALLLRAAMGSDGYSTLVNGIRLTMDIPFFVANLGVSLVFIGLAWLRGLRPGIGTVVQVLVVGFTVSAAMALIGEPSNLGGRIALLVVSLPVLSLGIAAYLGSHLGAGPAEGAALAWDPPIPFKWSYSVVQGGGALIGWLLDAAVGVGTIVVIFLLGPAVDLAARVLRVNPHQARVGDAAASRRSSRDVSR
jgi:uncharacterized membrane protein YczE